jgi:hypothetical protein
MARVDETTAAGRQNGNGGLELPDAPTPSRSMASRALTTPP